MITREFRIESFIRQACELLKTLSGTGGLHWDNLWQRVEPDDPMTMGLYWIMFIVDSIIFIAFMLYIDGIKPGTYGVGKTWYFPFQVLLCHW